MDENNHGSFNVASFGSTVAEAGDHRPFRGSISPARGALERFRPIANDELSPSNGQLQRGIHALIEAMRSALEGDGAAARYFIGNASASLSDMDGEGEPTAISAANSNRCCGGLAPWQIRRLMTHVEANLSGTIHCEDLARLVRLSLSHFMRVFKESFGCAPHAFLIRRRMERAQGLMLTTDEALGQIALTCGLADQSHLTRLFQKWVGESPAAWRRARMTALESP
jgi:AraC family transcriptional regulator